MKNLENYIKYIRKCKIKYENKSQFNIQLRSLFINILYLTSKIVKYKHEVTDRIDCDFLVILSDLSNRNKTEHIWNELNIRGNSVYFEHPNTKIFFRALKYLNRRESSTYEYLIAKSYANFLRKRYKPKIICSFHHFGPLPSIIREEFYDVCKTIYLPHAVIDNSYLYSNQDYDYYFVFGESSVKNILANKFRIGNCKIVQVGSPYINFIAKDYQYFNDYFLLISTWTLKKDKDLQRNFEIIFNWIKSKPNYILKIKLHPKEDPAYITSMFGKLKNVTILDNDTSIEESIKEVKYVISSYSVATIEAALFNRPIIVVNHFPKKCDSNDFRFSDKYLYLEDFFPSRARTENQIDKVVNEISSNYDYYKDACKRYVEFHLSGNIKSQNKILNTLESIYSNIEDFDYYLLPNSNKFLCNY